MPAASHITIRKRVVLIFLFISVIVSGLLGRLAYLQFYQSAWLAENAVEQRIREIPVEAKRGVIYDRNGRELAVSVNTESIFVIPAEVQNPEETAAALAAILPLSVENIRAKIEKRQSFTWLERKVDGETARRVQLLNLPGIGVTQESKRHYPNDNLAAHILGFTGIDSQGLDGVETAFDNYLKGTPGSIVIEYDARGREIPGATHRFVPPVEGFNIYLTIDSVIQQIIERELGEIMQDTQAKGATIIVLDPRNGALLALANRPDYNPNNFSAYSSDLWRNVAVSNSYEPGSTFKIITAAAALSEKAVSFEDKFFDPGAIEVQGRYIHCWRDGGHGIQTFAEVVQNSCNVGFVSVGLKLGREPFYKYIDAFGFGRLTDIDLPGEAKGILLKRESATPLNLATMSIGQSIAVTPVQLVAAVAAAANGGILFKPQILQEVTDKENNTVKTFLPQEVRRVISEETSGEIKYILEKVVADGTGRNAYADGFRIAGKTGTAQKAGPGGYEQGKYVASFAGFAPADEPQVAMLVIIDEPVGLYYGGQIAAPAFSAAMQDILKYLAS
ncbi:MAG: stage V sporulation protein D [Sporomusaceae bacterium]|nr:stage V sporulation protein D [Sporomusaceae bacterium]